MENVMEVNLPSETVVFPQEADNMAEAVVILASAEVSSDFAAD